MTSIEILVINKALVLKQGLLTTLESYKFTIDL